jgi:hypothetical protein
MNHTLTSYLEAHHAKEKARLQLQLAGWIFINLVVGWMSYATLRLMYTLLTF